MTSPPACRPPPSINGEGELTPALRAFVCGEGRIDARGAGIMMGACYCADVQDKL